MGLAGLGQWAKAERHWPKVYTGRGGAILDSRFVAMHDDGAIFVLVKSEEIAELIAGLSDDLAADLRALDLSLAKRVVPIMGASQFTIELLNILQAALQRIERLEEA